MKNILLFLLLVFLLFLRYRSFLPKFSDGEKIRITQRVLTEPIRYDKSQRITISIFKIYLPLFPEITYGDKIVVEGMVEKGELKSPKLIKIETKNNPLFVLRERLINFYQKTLPQPHAALVAGVVLGSKEGISSNFWDELKTTGTAHVVVASGMNVTLVASFLISILLLFFPRKQAVYTAIVGIWGYSLMSGMDAPIVRAAIMGSITFGAQAFGRVYLASRALFMSVILMLLVNPLWINDLGFILSVKI